MRCELCGHSNPDNAALCRMCQELLPVPAQPPSMPGFPRSESYEIATTRTPVTQPAEHERPFPSPAGMPQDLDPSTVARADVTGRVIAMDGPHLERPDLDICRIVTRTLWVLLLIASPLIFLRIVMGTLGGLSALLALLALFFFLRFLSPTNLFAMFHLAALLNPLGRREIDQVPVRYLRVRGLDGDREHVVRMKGALALSNVMPGDIVSCWGTFQGGVLRTTRAFSHRTQSWIEIERSHSALKLVATVLLIGFLVLYFFEPVMLIWQRLEEFRGSQGFHQP